MPVTPEFVEHVIKREKPDGIVVSMGGQTALNCAVQLHETGVLEKYNVQVSWHFFHFGNVVYAYTRLCLRLHPSRFDPSVATPPPPP